MAECACATLYDTTVRGVFSFFFSPIISPLFLSCIGPNSKLPVSRGCAAHQHYSLSCSFSVGGQCFPDLLHLRTHTASLLMVSFLLDGSHLETRNKLGGQYCGGTGLHRVVRNVASVTSTSFTFCCHNLLCFLLFLLQFC